MAKPPPPESKASSKANSGQFGAQLIGAVVLATVIFGVAYAFFYFQNKLTKGGIRSSAADEIAGLDIPEMGVDPYPEFVLRDEPVIELTDRELVRAAQDSEDEKELVTIGKHQVRGCQHLHQFGETHPPSGAWKRDQASRPGPSFVVLPRGHALEPLALEPRCEPEARQR